MAPYPSRSEIEKLCSHLGTADPSPFFDRVSPDVVWDVMGTALTQLQATSLALGKAWKKGAYGVINGVLRESLKQKVTNVVGGGDQDWAVVELEADAICKNGMEYPQRYAWIMRFDQDGIIVEVRAYLDSALVQKAVDSNQ